MSTPSVTLKKRSVLWRRIFQIEQVHHNLDKSWLVEFVQHRVAGEAPVEPR